MKIYLKTGFTSGFIPVILASLLVPLGLLALSISISIEVAKSCIDGLIFQTIAWCVLALAAYTFTVAMVLLSLQTAPELYRAWIQEAREAMWLHHRQRLKDSIASMKPIYRKYRIYPELKIYQDWSMYS